MPVDVALDDVIKADKANKLDQIFPDNPWAKGKNGNGSTTVANGEGSATKAGEGTTAKEGEEATAKADEAAKTAKNPAKKRKRATSPTPQEIEAKRRRQDPFMFLYGHKHIIVLGEEDFSISYEIAKHFRPEQLKSGECRVVGAAYRPNDYETDYDDKFKTHNGELRYNCDAQNASTFNGDKFDAVVFTFPRLYESLSPEFVKEGGADTGTKYFQMNRTFFGKWFANARDHLVPGGKIYIVLIPKQFESWHLNEVCCKVGMQWAMLGEFQFRNCIYYKPKNEKGEEWFPHHPLLFSVFKPPQPTPGMPLPMQAPPMRAPMARPYPPHPMMYGRRPPMYPHQQLNWGAPRNPWGRPMPGPPRLPPISRSGWTTTVPNKPASGTVATKNGESNEAKNGESETTTIPSNDKEKSILKQKLNFDEFVLPPR